VVAPVSSACGVESEEAPKLRAKSICHLTAVIERGDAVYVALCPALDLASQGDSVESAKKNLVEALELFFESADCSEISRRLHNEVFVTRVEVAVG
jgi:predicted RNase H-like HicB family nuclease